MFTKGQPVLYIAPWDDKGNFYGIRAEVHSAGKVRMVLNSRLGGCLGRNFRPVEDQGAYRRVLANNNETIAASIALESGARQRAAIIANYELRLARRGEHHFSDGYCDVIQGLIDGLRALPAPTFHWRA